MMLIPESFRKRLKEQIEDADLLFEVLEGEAPTSVRLNPSKLSKPFKEVEVVPWLKEGKYLPLRPKYSLDPLFHAGCYYPMEASSMFLSHVLKQIELTEDDLILDLCAAPGGKTLVLRDSFPDSPLVSNEIDSNRVHILKENSVKWGVENQIVIQSSADKLLKSELQFQLVLIDAPCSGEGLFRKDKASITEWSLERAKGCSVRQQDILSDAKDLVKPGGYLVYSTCTYNAEENIGPISVLVDSGAFESVPIEYQESWGVEQIGDDLVTGCQFWPHRLEGEGFFISVLKRKGTSNWELPIQRDHALKKVPEAIKALEEDLYIYDFDGVYYGLSGFERDLVKQLRHTGKIIKRGISLGQLKGKDFLFNYDLALNKRSNGLTPVLELNEVQALAYLKGEALNLNTDKGVILIKYKGHSLGYGKSNGKRINNLYPKHLRNSA